MPNLQLYIDAQYTSPYAMSVFVALTEKQLPFQEQLVDLNRGDNQALAYTTRSLTSRVPTLIHGDFQLSESSAITEYIDETFAGIALYPQDRQHKARARQLQAWLRSDLMPIRQERSTQVIFYQQKGLPLSTKAKQAADKLFFAAQQLLQPNADYLFGEWSLADVDLALMLQRLICNGDAVPARLVDYAHAQWQHPAIQAWAKKIRPTL